DVFLFEPWHLRRQLEPTVALDQIDRGLRDPGIGLPERLEVKGGPPERQPERGEGEVLEQPVDLAAQALERPPHLHRLRRRRRRGGLFVGDRDLGFSFCHWLPPSSARASR